MRKKISSLISLLLAIVFPFSGFGQGYYFARPAAGGGASTLFTDNFDTQATGTDLGANWTESVGNHSITAGDTLQMAAVVSSPTLAITTSSAHADTADVKVTVTQVAVGDGGPMARCTEADATPTCYTADCYSGEITLYRHNNSASGTPLGAATVSTAANGIIALEVTGNGATVTLKVYYNGSLVINTTDTSGSRITAAGRTGVFNWDSNGSTTSQYDTFKVETAP